jgi:hypothetical protein
MSSATFYKWRSKYWGIDAPAMRTINPDDHAPKINPIRHVRVGKWNMPNRAPAAPFICPTIDNSASARLRTH